MDILDDNSESLSSKIYLDLANIVGEFAKLERKSARMREKLIECEGSDCSALVPSDDDATPMDDDEYPDSEWEDDDDDDEQEEEDEEDEEDEENDQTKSALSTTDSQILAPLNRRLSRRQDSVTVSTPSGYYMKHMDSYYCVPKDAIVRCYAEPFVVHSMYSMRKLTEHGQRTRAWLDYVEAGILTTNHVVVVEMKKRQGGKDYVWCIILSKYTDSVFRQPAQTQDHLVLYTLPEATVCKFVYILRQARVRPTLVDRFLPSFVKDDDHSTENQLYEDPLPGQSRKRKKTTGTGATSMPVAVNEHGNWWDVLPASCTIRRAVDDERRRYLRRLNRA